MNCPARSKPRTKMSVGKMGPVCAACWLIISKCRLRPESKSAHR
jgi:hypothetical protein